MKEACFVLLQVTTRSGLVTHVNTLPTLHSTSFLASSSSSSSSPLLSTPPPVYSGGLN
jgi:hypothetical protein